MFRLVFVILRTKNRLILCHFTHCDLMSFSPLLIISSVFHEGGVLLRIHAIVSSNFSTGWMWTKQSPIRKSVSLYMCVCHCVCESVCVCATVCVCVGVGWSGGMHECVFMFILFQIQESTCVFKMLQVLYWEESGKLLTLFLKVGWHMWKEEVRIIVRKDRMKPL